MRRSGSVLLFALVSLALHLAWLVGMPSGERPVRPEERWVEVSFEAAPSPAAEPAPQPSSNAAVVAPAVPESRARPERIVKKAQAARASKPVPPSAAELSTSSMDVSELQPTAAAPAQPEQPAKQPQLSPRAAALSLDAFALPAALRCAAPGSAGQAAGPSDCASGEGKGEAAQAALSRDLKTIAKNVPHLITREAPELKRRSDGSYTFDGHVFQALVKPDGQVEFTDDVARVKFAQSLIPFKVVADLNDIAERSQGRELYSAEKAWFLEQTRELRTQLTAEARRQELQRANRELERTLQQVLGDRALSKSQKHDAVFLIWQDCGEDAQQKAHRRAVEAFVRRYMPSDSELGFGAEELERFNRERGGQQHFEPYSDSKG